MKVCIHCEEEFDHLSRAKAKVGGKINECPTCVELLGTETAVRYLGVPSNDGKMAGIQIIACDDDASREAYIRAHRHNSGMNKGKACNISMTGSTVMGGMRGIRVIGDNLGNPNHKGKS